MISRVCLVSYHELGLKGNNRAKFERRLIDNIDFALKGYPVSPARKIAGRILVEPLEPAILEKISQKIALLAGVAHTTPAYRIGRSVQEIEHVALRVLQEAGPFETFRVTSKRSNTDFAITSMDLNIHVGSFLVEQTGARVNLSNPDTEVSITIVEGDTYISAAKIQGIGGLPAGSSGKVISLLSSGIDSPVATWRLLRRGAIGVGVHFSGRPQTSGESVELVRDLGKVLARTGSLGRIYSIDFGDIQKDIALAVAPQLRVIMYRRLMIVVAEKIGAIEGAQALITGESLGQVASQTLENIGVVDNIATLPVFRPLIGSDKNEIIVDARRIGTFDLSALNAADCCTLFMPRKPETRAQLEDVLNQWNNLPIDEYIERSLESMSYFDYPCRMYKAPKGFPRTTIQESVDDES